MNNAFGLKNITINKILLFVVGYSPLFLIISIKKLNYKIVLFNQTSPIQIISIFCILLFIASIIYSYYLIYSSKKISQEYFTIKNVDEKTDIILSYFIPYIISVIPLRTNEEIISAILIFTFIFLIYVHSEIIYFNPLFIFFGYKFYRVYTKKNYVLMLTKKDLYLNIDETIIVKQLNTRLYIVVGD